jgi:hypothetical protein
MKPSHFKNRIYLHGHNHTGALTTFHHSRAETMSAIIMRARTFEMDSSNDGAPGAF